MSDKHDLLNDNDMCSFSGHEVEDMCFNSGDDACGDGRVDVKGKIGNIEKRLKIKGFKTKGSIFECYFWSFFFLSVETYRIAENGRVVATLLI